MGDWRLRYSPDSDRIPFHIEGMDQVHTEPSISCLFDCYIVMSLWSEVLGWKERSISLCKIVVYHVHWPWAAVFLLFYLLGLARLTFCHWDNDQEWMIVVLQCIILNGERVVHVIASGNRDNKLSSTDSWSNLVACFA